MKKPHTLTRIMFLCAIMLFTGAQAQQRSVDADTENEIKRIRKELLQIQEERRRIATDREDDKKEFETYRKNILAKMRTLSRETDSLKTTILSYKGVEDSLAAVIATIRSGKREYELLQDGFRNRLVESVSSVAALTPSLPPAHIEKSSAALQLLKNELSTKSIDNVEGMTRLFQIVRDMDDVGGTIQIMQGTSPLAEIRGTVYRLRIGALVEAVVNLQGTQAALWHGYDENRAAIWRTVDDPLKAEQILKAVNIRDAKALPSLVTLPLGHLSITRGETPDNE